LDLTQEQQAIVAHDPDRHARIAAGPGTGKSTTGVALVEHLLKLQDPPRVRFLTFTRAATAELAKKISAVPELAVERPSTVHSFSISALLRNPGVGGYPQPLRLADTWEQTNIIRADLAHRLDVSVRRVDLLIREMAAKWESLVDAQAPQVPAHERARFRGAFTEHRRTYGYTLLAELPDLLRRALIDHDELQGLNYDMLVVDEYQDLNACDLQLLRLIGDRGTSIVAVGDDDQSIYSFRKADPAGFRRFHDDYADADEYPLSEAKRSARQIVDWAQFVIDGDADRPEKPALHAPDDADEGVVALLRFPTHESEARHVAQLIEALRRRDVPASDILVLSRSDYRGTFTRALRDELVALEIPVQNPDALDDLMGDPANRRFLAIARLIGSREDSLAWRTLYFLQGGAGAGFVGHFYRAAVGDGTTFARALADEAAGNFGDIPVRYRGLARAVWDATVAVLDAIEAEPQDLDATWPDRLRALIADVHGFPEPTEKLWELMDEVASKVDKNMPIDRFVGELQGLGKDILQSSSQGVRVMAMMGSKGLTVAATIVLGVENDLVPRHSEDLSEERRLLYVAMTRSRSYLFLTWARHRTGPPARAGRENLGVRRPSDFLTDGPVETESGPTFVTTFAEDTEHGEGTGA
jgi:DNA helicase-2/ATP-dependent DNA helicase PcrA